MRWNDTPYGIVRRITGQPYDQVLEATRASLAGEGFGILTEIDVQATLQNKLGVQTPHYRILGACNPALAHRALTAEAGIGLLLPCNVVVAEDGEDVVVAAVEPVRQFQVVDRQDLGPIAEEVRERLSRALDQIAD